MSATVNHLLVQDVGKVRILTLDRAEKLNALNRPLVERLTQELANAEASEDVRAVVIAGCPKAFSAGVDLNETKKLSSANDIGAHADRIAGLFLALNKMETPVIAAVEGFALGGGCGLAMACDSVVASNTAVFGYPEVTKGVMPALVAPNLVKRIGPKDTFILLALGQQYSAKAFREMGLVSAIVTPGTARAEAISIAGTLAAHDRRIIGWIKSLVRNCDGLSLEDGFAHAREVNASTRETLKTRER
ncbi:enoyl-CoA hydratase/isomerase family protein [Sneathiella sp.]|uniref:enoyl-CoA hydratase/isomerase family protein n=1 Tax=Sneathiella sp. TaxID=1964365 RepID=UPI00356B179E